MENSNSNVAQIAPEPLRRIALSDEDRLAVHMLLEGVDVAHAALGAELEQHDIETRRLEAALAREAQRHESEKQELLRAVSARRERMNALVGVLASKYVKGPGRFDFKPDLGAFIETKE